MENTRVAVVGAGVIGHTHLQAIGRVPGFVTSGIVEPGPQASRMAEDVGCRLYPDLDALIADRPDAAIVATPNDHHADPAIALLEAGIPTLVEKPLAETAARADEIVAAAARTGTPGLVGHHRRYNGLIRACRDRIAAGDFGALVAGTVTCTLYKPPHYFDVEWRQRRGSGGPLLINMIHEVDLVQFLFGPIGRVTAVASHEQRGLEVEDTAAAMLEFKRGGLVTLVVTDAAVGPWAWDITAGENLDRFPAHDAVSHAFAGTRAGFSLPDAAWWSHDGDRDWMRQMPRTTIDHDDVDCYERQVEHLGAVSRGAADPIAPLDDGRDNLRVIEAIVESAETRAPVTV